MQAASKSRRRFKHSGSGTATSGRRVNDMPAHSLNIRLDTGDDEAGDEIIFNDVGHSLPTQKKKKKKQHSFWLQKCRAIGLCLTKKIKIHDIY